MPCHRDNFEKGARVMVEIFDDRVEITNPGGLPKGITKENFGTTSITRNPIIASLLHRADYIERMGTGINRMTSAMEKAGLEKPIFKTEGSFFKVIFMRDELEHNGGMATINSDKLAIGSDRLAIDISDREPTILNYLNENGKGKSADFVKLLGLSHQRIRQILQSMIKSGLIDKHGENRHTYYTATKGGQDRQGGQ